MWRRLCGSEFNTGRARLLQHACMTTTTTIRPRRILIVVSVSVSLAALAVGGLRLYASSDLQMALAGLAAFCGW